MVAPNVTPVIPAPVVPAPTTPQVPPQTAVQHRPMSVILAPAPDAPVEKTPSAPVAPVVTPPLVPVEPALVAPDKYAGKTVEQVIEMHQNAETRLGQIQNEVGTLRGVVTDLTQLQRTSLAPQLVEQDDIDVSGDDLIQRPVESIRKVVAHDNAAQKVVDDATRLETDVARESNALLVEFGNIDTIVGTEEFRSFAGRTPTRQADLVTAATGTGLPQVRAARRLLEDFNDFQDALKPVTPDIGTVPILTPVQQARAVSTEGAGPAGPISVKEPIYEADVLTMIRDEPVKYRSPTFQAELTSAIKEGRFVKSG